MTPDIDLDALTASVAQRPPADRLDYLLTKFGEAYHSWYVTEADSDERMRDGLAALIHGQLDETLSALTATRAELDAFMHARIQGDDMAARVTWLSDELVRVEAERDFWKSKRHPDAARQDVEYWKGKYEAGAMDQLAAAPQPDDERWTWAVSCPGCGQAKGHPCIGALGGDGAVHPERRGRAVAVGYGLNAAAGAGDGDWLDPSTPAPEEARVLHVGDGEQDTATTHSTGTTQVWPSFADQCVTTHTGSTWAGAGAPASVQGAADGEAQA